MGNPHGSKRSDSWRTPNSVFKALDAVFQFQIDAASSPANHLCPVYWTEQDSALAKDWSQGTIWCNPPYSQLPLDDGWVAKFKEMERGALLVPPKTDTKWWHSLFEDKQFHLLLTSGRIVFDPPISTSGPAGKNQLKKSMPTLPMLFLLKCSAAEVRNVQFLLSLIGLDPMWINAPERAYQGLDTAEFEITVEAGSYFDVTKTSLLWRCIGEAKSKLRKNRIRRAILRQGHWSLTASVGTSRIPLDVQIGATGTMVLTVANHREIGTPLAQLLLMSSNDVRAKMGDLMVEFLNIGATTGKAV